METCAWKKKRELQFLVCGWDFFGGGKYGFSRGLGNFGLREYVAFFFLTAGVWFLFCGNKSARLFIVTLERVYENECSEIFHVSKIFYPKNDVYILRAGWKEKIFFHFSFTV